MSLQGKVMYYLGVIATMFPLVIIDVPIWLTIILAVAIWIITMIPFVNTITQAALWIWGFIALFQRPFSILYIIGVILCVYWLLENIVFYIAYKGR